MLYNIATSWPKTHFQIMESMTLFFFIWQYVFGCLFASLFEKEYNIKEWKYIKSVGVSEAKQLTPTKNCQAPLSKFNHGHSFDINNESENQHDIFNKNLSENFS